MAAESDVQMFDILVRFALLLLFSSSRLFNHIYDTKYPFLRIIKAISPSQNRRSWDINKQQNVEISSREEFSILSPSLCSFDENLCTFGAHGDSGAQRSFCALHFPARRRTGRRLACSFASDES
jgi:hypothetical protein